MGSIMKGDMIGMCLINEEGFKNQADGTYIEELAEQSLSNFKITESVQKDITTAIAVDQLVQALRSDPGYYYSWQANIAMAFVDEFKENGVGRPSKDTIHKLANDSAKRFLDMLLYVNKGDSNG